MIELAAGEFYKARPLFEGLMGYQMFCAGVLEGIYAGRVWVDAADQPRCGFVCKDGMWWFLAGDPQQAAFGQALNRALFERQVSGEKGWGGMLVCQPEAWGAQMATIYAPHVPIQTERLHYVCGGLRVDWRAAIPAGFEVRFVDEELAASGIVVEGAAAEVLRLRQGAGDADGQAVGFVAIHEGKIVASSVIDCIVKGGGDIGLYTDPAYRRRNLAYVTAAAVIEYALAHGVEVVHWDCESFNRGSIRTAEKLGLRFSHAHTMYTLIFNPVRHELNRAWGEIDKGRSAAALAICLEGIERGGERAHAEYFYIAARCYWMDGARDEAVRFLGLAAAGGWDGLEEMQGDFGALEGHEKWEAIVARVTQNAGGD